MGRHDRILDRIVGSAAGHGPACGCQRCRDRRRREGGGCPLCLPEWRGWSDTVAWPVLLDLGRRTDAWLAPRSSRTSALDAARALGVAPALLPWFRRSTHLYRFSRVGQSRPIDIGMTTQPIIYRLMQHALPPPQLQSTAMKAARGTLTVRRRIMAHQNGVRVQYGRFSGALLRGGRPDRRYLHAFEIALQHHENTQTYRQSTTTFEA